MNMEGKRREEMKLERRRKRRGEGEGREGGEKREIPTIVRPYWTRTVANRIVTQATVYP